MTEAQTPLKSTDCPLLPEADRAACVARYNAQLARVEMLRAAAAGLPGFDGRLTEIEESLDDLRAKMERSHYRIGFLGTTGSGKSTTFNNLLRVSAEDAPAKSGGGPATTAAPARLRRAAGTAPVVRLDFMRHDEYEQRRNRLAAKMGLGRELSEDDLIERCRVARAGLAAGESMRVRLDDAVALESLIRSRHAFPALVAAGATRVSKPGLYADRAGYLNHRHDPAQTTPQPEASENRLLWEVAIDFPSEVMPANLEMVDLPGLGATSYHDTCVTLDIIENRGEEGLDGAMIFLRCGLLSDVNVDEILQALQEAWGSKFNGRVWLVYNQYDTLSPAHFTGTPNFFSGVDGRLKQYRVPTNCVFVTSNTLLASFTPDMTPERRADVAGIRFGRPLTDSHLARHFAAFAYFEALIRGVYADGGLDLLRDAIQTRLGAAIGLELTAGVLIKLAACETAIEATLRTAERRRSQSSEDVEKVAACAKAVNRVLQRVRGGLPEIKEATLKLRDGLQSVVPKYSTVDDLANLRPQDVLAEFKTLTNRLDRDLGVRLVNEGVEPVYQRLTQEFGALPPLPLAGADSVQQAWANATAAECDVANWKADLPRFEQLELIEQICSTANPIQGQQFKDLLDEQIHAVTLVSMFRLRERLTGHLTKLSEELKLLVHSN